MLTTIIMKTSTIKIALFTAVMTLASAKAQTSLVGTGSSYDSIFSGPDEITYDVPGVGGILNLNLSNGFDTKTSGIWNLRAQGGANTSILGFGLFESAAQTSLTGTQLEFNISNDNNTLLGLLGVGPSLHYGWQATATFGTLSYTSFTTYHVSFEMDGNNGLLSSVVGLNPGFGFELLDGSGNPLLSNGSGTLVNIAGLLGTGVTSGTVEVDYTVAGSAPAGAIGIRFTGDATLGATALGLGTGFATISNVNITASPVPEPGSGFLVAALGAAVLLRRRRLQS
ncbi:MAG: hypothetical protein JWO08_1269 [Verrucomicrobiaceae bacterium]|nr:hypothetical protein [Verrucomicrobiaceae bacterium]